MSRGCSPGGGGVGRPLLSWAGHYIKLTRVQSAFQAALQNDDFHLDRPTPTWTKLATPVYESPGETVHIQTHIYLSHHGS